MARPVGIAGRLARWAMRNPLAAGLLAGVASFLLILFVAGAAAAAWNLRRLAASEHAAHESADAQRDLAIAARGEAEGARQLAEGLAEERRRSLYSARINLAHQAWQKGNTSRVLDLLERLRPDPGQADLRGFEWYYLWALCHGETLSLRGQSGPVRAVAFSPDGKSLATASGTAVVICDRETGRVKTSLWGHSDRVLCVAFSPDGTWVASGSEDRTVKIWDLGTGSELASLKGHDQPVGSIAFAPDGKSLASTAGPCSRRSAIPSFDSSARRREGRSSSGACRPVGEAPGSLPARSRCWPSMSPSPPTERPWPRETSPGPFRCGGRRPGNGWQPSPGIAGRSSPWRSRRTARSWPRAVTIRRHGSGTSTAARRRPSSRINPVRSSPSRSAPDGKTVASGGHDQTVWLWETATQKEAGRIRGHRDRVWSVAFSPDGKAMATAGEDGTARLWNPERPPGHDSLDGRWPNWGHGAYALAFSPDGRAWPPPIPTWTSGTGNRAEGRHLLLAPGRRHAGGLFPGRRYHRRGRARRSSVPRRREVPRSSSGAGAASGKVWSIVYSSDGQSLATSCDDGVVRIWDPSDGKLSGQLDAGTASTVRAVALSPDGKTLAAAYHLKGQSQSLLHFWDLPTRRIRATLRGAHVSRRVGRLLARREIFRLGQLGPDRQALGWGDRGPDRCHDRAYGRRLQRVLQPRRPDAWRRPAGTARSASGRYRPGRN